MLYEYFLAPIGGLYLFVKTCNIFSNLFFKQKTNVNSKCRTFDNIEGIQTKIVSQDYGKSNNINSNEKSVFIVNLNNFDNNSSNSFFSDSKCQDDKNYKHISKIVDFILLNVKPDEEIILNIDSPGGSVIEYFYIYNQLYRLKKKGHIINAFIKKIAASGGYLLASIGKIHATHDAYIGSVGVYKAGFNFSQLLKMFNIYYKLYKSGNFKNLGDPYDTPTEESDIKQQEDTEKLHCRFKQVLINNRPNMNVDAISSADVWLGDEAKQLGFIDEIAIVNDHLMEEAKSKIIYEIYYDSSKKKSSGLLNIILSSMI